MIPAPSGIKAHMLLLASSIGTLQFALPPAALFGEPVPERNPCTQRIQCELTLLKSGAVRVCSGQSQHCASHNTTFWSSD